jgi:hypothetical protein
MRAVFQSRSGRHARVLSALLLLASAPGLAGCSSVIDHIPQALGGMPDGVPARPAIPAAFPAVHDMPPNRGDAPLTEADRKRLQDDLIAARQRAEQAVTAAAAAEASAATTGSTPPAGAAPNP